MSAYQSVSLPCFLAHPLASMNRSPVGDSTFNDETFRPVLVPLKAMLQSISLRNVFSCGTMKAMSAGVMVEFSIVPLNCSDAGMIFSPSYL